jgi:hypothetical protein
MAKIYKFPIRHQTSLPTDGLTKEEETILSDSSTMNLAELIEKYRLNMNEDEAEALIDALEIMKRRAERK